MYELNNKTIKECHLGHDCIKDFRKPLKIFILEKEGCKNNGGVEN